MELFKIVLPDKRVPNAEEMYYTSDTAQLVFDENNCQEYLRLNRGETVTFDRYFNLFSYEKYLRFTKVQKIRVALQCKGSVAVSLMAHRTWNGIRGDYTTEVLQTIQLDSDEKTTAEIEWDFSSERLKTKRVERYNSAGKIKNKKAYSITGFYYLKVVALSDDARIFGGAYYADEVEMNPVRMAIGICSYRREKYVVENTSLIKRELIDNPESSIAGALDIFVADNGQTLKEYMEESEHVKIFYNKNYGGSGGFTRTLMEVWYRRNEFTHILLMDDDIVIEPNVLIKTINFLRVLREEYANAHIGGSMLHITSPCYQYEMGANWSGKAKSWNRWDVSSVKNLLENEAEKKVNFNGWFYTCMPINVMEKNGLPFPFFIKGDDIEYGIRNADKIIMMNGIGVWHEPYIMKFSSHLRYFDYRNKLVLDCVHNQMHNEKKIRKVLKNRCVEALYRQEYDTAEFYMLAMEDFLKGVDFFLNQEEDKYLQKLLKMRETSFMTAKELKKKKCRFSQVQFEKSDKYTKNVFWNLIDSITCNANLLPKIFYKRDLQIVNYEKYNPKEYRRCSKVLQWSPTRNKGMLTQVHRKRFLKLRIRLLVLEWKVRLNYERVAKEYVERTREITSLEYWEKHLNLPLTYMNDINIAYQPEIQMKKKRVKSPFMQRMERVVKSEVHRRDYVDVAYGNIVTTWRRILRKLHLSKLSKKMVALQKLKNIHCGERCFIVCPGPSLTIEDVEKLKNEYTFGVNSIYNAYDNTDWRPTYYVMCDASGYRRQEVPWNFEEYSKEKVFLNDRIRHWQKGFTDKTVTFVFNHRTSEHYKAPTLPMRAEKNIDVCIYDRCTVTNAAIDIALYMGFKKIYLIGVDHNYSGKRHFVDTEDDVKRTAPSKAHLKLSEDGYEESLMNAVKHKARIYNVTRGGKLNVFPRKILEEVLEER